MSNKLYLGTEEVGLGISSNFEDKLTNALYNGGDLLKPQEFYKSTNSQQVFNSDDHLIIPLTTDKAVILQDGTSLKGKLAQLTGGNISNYTHYKNGTVHNLIGDGLNIRLISTDDFTQGDTFTVNGITTEVENQNGQPLGTGAIKTNDIVLGVISGNKLKLFCRQVPYLMWSGSLSGGVITITHIQKFRLICAYISNLGLTSWGTHSMSGRFSVTTQTYVANEYVTALAEFTVSENTLNYYNAAIISHISNSFHNGITTRAIQQIWGM